MHKKPIAYKPMWEIVKIEHCAWNLSENGGHQGDSNGETVRDLAKQHTKCSATYFILVLMNIVI